MGKYKDSSHFNVGHTGVTRQPSQSIYKTVVSTYKMWSKKGQQLYRHQGHGLLTPVHRPECLQWVCEHLNSTSKKWKKWPDLINLDIFYIMWMVKWVKVLTWGRNGTGMPHGRVSVIFAVFSWETNGSVGLLPSLRPHTSTPLHGNSIPE